MCQGQLVVFECVLGNRALHYWDLWFASLLFPMIVIWSSGPFLNRPKRSFFCLSGAVTTQFAIGACAVLGWAFSLFLWLVAALRLFGSCGNCLKTGWLAGRTFEAE
jgi:hypothetical protein